MRKSGITIKNPVVEYKGIGNYVNQPHALYIIEYAARTCYQSHHKASNNMKEAIKFVKNLLKRGHTSVSSHVQVTFYCHEDIFWKFWKEVMEIGKYRWFDILFDNDMVYLSGNFRVWYESLVELVTYYEFLDAPWFDCYGKLVHLMFPDLLEEYKHNTVITNTMAVLPPQSTPIELTRPVFKVYADRATIMEWDRHTTLATSQESQRYVKYTSLPVRKIPEVEEDALNSVLWFESVSKSATTYKNLLKRGIHQQFARSVLPNCTMMNAVFSGLVPFWVHFVKLRTDKAAHPHIRVLAEKVKKIIESQFQLEIRVKT